MKDGRVQQIGTPLEVYGRPANKFVASFIGAPAMNFLEVTVRGEAGVPMVEAPGMRMTISDANARALTRYEGRRVTMGMRPEHIELGDTGAGRTFDARVEVVEQLGSEILLETRAAGTSVTVARVPAETPIAAGDKVQLSVQPGRLHFFDLETEIPITG